MMKPNTTTIGCVLLGAALLAGGLTGCRGDRSAKPPRRFFPDMDKQPKWQPQGETEFFVDGRTQRLPVANTVAFGPMPLDPGAVAGQAWAEGFTAARDAALAANPAVYTGKDGDGPDGWAAMMPIEVTADMVKRGGERFNIYCATCHGYLGAGNSYAGGAFASPVGERWGYSPANLLGEPFDDRAQARGTDGWLFDVTRNGLWGPDGANKMPGYGHALDTEDAWAVVAYLRVLQASQNAAAESLSAEQKQQLGGDAGEQGGGS